MNTTKPEYNDNTITIDPITKKINCAIPEVTCFVASILFEKFTEDEIIAIILHEIGHNTQCATAALQITISSSATSILKWLIISPVAFKTLQYLDETTMSKEYISIILISVIAIIVFFNFIAAYLSRRQEYGSDEFVAKCGYGEALKTALSKLGLFMQTYDKFQSNFNSLSLKCEYYVKKIFTIITNIMTMEPLTKSHPHNTERFKAIDDTMKKMV